MSIKNQANFWLKNVCDFDVAEHNFADETIEGFNAFSTLMRNIYEDYHSFEISTKGDTITKIGIAENDLENYHNLTETVDCLYKMSAVGELDVCGEEVCLKIDKTLFKTKFKKSVAFVFSMLEKHGFYFLFYKNGNEVKEYKQCNTFCLYYENSDKLIPSMKLLADTLAKQTVKTDLSNGLAFFMADYEAIFTGAKATPKKQNIINLLGDLTPLWLSFANNADKFGLDYDLTINPYVFPNWTVKILSGKKTVCTFNINSGSLLIRLPLSFEMAKDLISVRKTLPNSINNCISRWNCVNCGKCENQSNIEIVEGVPLCTLKYSNFCTEDSRILSFYMTTQSELKTVNDLIATAVSL